LLLSFMLLVCHSANGQHPQAPRLYQMLEDAYDAYPKSNTSGYASARRLYDEAVELNAVDFQIQALVLMSGVRARQRLYAEQDTLIKKAELISSNYGDTTLLASVRCQRAAYCINDFRWAESLENINQARRMYRIRGWLPGQFQCALLLARLYREQGLLDKAIDEASWVIQEGLLLKDTTFVAHGLLSLALTENANGMIEQAYNHINESEKRYSRLGFSTISFDLRLAMADIEIKHNKINDARDHLRYCELFLDESSTYYDHAYWHLVNARLLVALNELDDALVELREHIHLAEQSEYYPFVLDYMELEYDILQLKNKTGEAHEALQRYLAKEQLFEHLLEKRELSALDDHYSSELNKRISLELQKQELIDSQSFSRLLIIVISLLLVVSLVAGYLFYRNRKQLADARYAKLHLEQQALASQMNPHFIFNALNSIQSSILTEDKMVAYEFHNKFTRLMRRILTLSREEVVSLKEELETLMLYIDLERFRTDNAFDVTYDIDPSINQERQKIPSLLFQPYVENAIWHGIMPSGRKGLLEISLQSTVDHIICIVRDNGSGRTASITRNAKKRTPHQSVGMEVTATRVQLFNRKMGQQVRVSIVDIARNGKSVGTEVQFTIPVRNQASTSEKE
ncbi:MAG: histidine kinase, partial [Flavobacteriales bacterium]|nr:histidine kinase [Flavobacteriales bacterium]